MILTNRLTELVEGNAEPIIEQWKQKIQTALSTTRLSEKEQQFIEREARNLLTHLREWLYFKSRSDIGQRYVLIGGKLFNHGIPLCEAHQALYFLKNLIRGHVCHHSLSTSALDVIHLQNFCDQVNLFFDRANYYLLRGYTENMNKKIKRLWNLKDSDIEQIIYKNSFYQKD